MQTLFQIRRLAETAQDGRPLALIVTTQYYWQPALGQTLEEVFQLTATEQVIVRALVEGRDAKTIANNRGTSEGTVRSQIKSILAKMNARSQSEIIRLVLSLRDISIGAGTLPIETTSEPEPAKRDWLDAEVWKPFKTLTLPDGRRLDYHDMGRITGAPILFTHMGYCMVRWARPMLKMAFQHGLRIIFPIRAGYGNSSDTDPKSDTLATLRSDTQHLLDHLNIKRLPYVAQGDDLLFACDLAAHHPDVVSDIIGVCGRLSMPGDRHYASMGKWHRFFLSTAKHAPHLLTFTIKAAVSLATRIGPVEMFRKMNKDSPADMSLLSDPEALPVMIANGRLIASKEGNGAKAYIKEVIVTEAGWTERIIASRATPIQLINGSEDPSVDVATLAEYREYSPWIEIEVIPNEGQMLIYQHFETVIPRIAETARKAADATV